MHDPINPNLLAHPYSSPASIYLVCIIVTIHIAVQVQE